MTWTDYTQYLIEPHTSFLSSKNPISKKLTELKEVWRLFILNLEIKSRWPNLPNLYQKNLNFHTKESKWSSKLPDV